MTEIKQGDYRINIGNDYIFIQRLSYKKVLVLDKFTGSIKETEEDELLNKTLILSTIKPHAILGIIKIGSIEFLLYVKSALLVGTFEGAEIFKVKEADLIPICDDITISNISNEIKSFYTGIKNLLTLGYYYSFHYDLTNSRQKQMKLKSLNVLDNVEKKFFWNQKLYSKFFKNNVDKTWIVVLICGYVGIENLTIDNNNIQFTLISRRSKYHAGTRYNTRGVDDDGRVANFIETEQLIRYKNYIMSYVQVRGSVPVFFQQTGLTAQTTITRTPEMTVPGFMKHIEELQKDFSMLFIINLMNTMKPNEQAITSSLENQMKINNPKSVKYFFYDFQNECKYDNYENLDSFIENLENVFNIFKFYCEDTNTGEVHKQQSGIIRTNCLDCLDRTNVIQTRVAWRLLEIQLSFLNVNVTSLFGKNFSKPLMKVHPLMNVFKEHWADNGDHISIQYAGTASTITSVTKTGKHGLLGVLQHGLVSITRFYQGSFEDSFKQKCIDLFLHKHHNEPLMTDPQIEEEIKKYEDKYTIKEDLVTFIGTWNVGGKELKDGTLLFEWLFPMKDMKNPDIYIIGLQEIVNLNAKNIVLSTNSSKVEFWKNLILKNLNEIDKYVLIKDTNLIGLFLIVLVKESIKENIRNIEHFDNKLGMMGALGNKGSLMLKFNYLDTSIALCCSHLAAGQSNNNNRVTDLIGILNKTFPKDINKKFKEYDIFYVFGDLNFRIDLDISSCHEFIEQKELKKLASLDQLNKTKSVNSQLNDLTEGALNFNPTYKYVPGTHEYDFKKKRVPAWCDRILFNKTNKIELIAYDRVEYVHSDHKPIYGLFKIRTEKILKEEKIKIMNELKENINFGINIVNNQSESIINHINDDFFNSTKLGNNQNNLSVDLLGLGDLNLKDTELKPSHYSFEKEPKLSKNLGAEEIFEFFKK